MSTSRARLLRRMTINRLQRVHRETVPVTIVTRARAEALLRARARSSATMTALLAHEIAQALSEHPEMNAGLDNDGAVIDTNLCLGVAVGLADGELIVPAIEHADSMSLQELSDRLAALIAAARAGKLTVADTGQATFLLSNVGMDWRP